MVSHVEPRVADEPVAEQTLPELLTHAVRTTVPTRLYRMLHLALPVAVDFAFRGWWRPAAAALAITAFGAWGLADRWLWNAADYDFAGSRGWRLRVARLTRLAAGATAGLVTALLLLELFLRLLGDAPIS